MNRAIVQTCYVILLKKKRQSLYLLISLLGFMIPQTSYVAFSSSVDSGSWCRSWVMTSAVGDVLIVVSVVSDTIGISDSCVPVCCTNWRIEVTMLLFALSEAEVWSPAISTQKRAGMLATTRDTLPWKVTLQLSAITGKRLENSRYFDDADNGDFQPLRA